MSRKLLNRPKNKCSSCNKELANNKPGYKHKLCKSCCKKGIKLSAETRKNMSVARIGIKFSENHISNLRNHLKKINVKGKNYKENAGYHAIHKWIQDVLGKPKICVFCRSTTEKRYEWANLSGKYLRDKKDFVRLCKSCHERFDKKRKINFTGFHI